MFDVLGFSCPPSRGVPHITHVGYPSHRLGETDIPTTLTFSGTFPNNYYEYASQDRLHTQSRVCNGRHVSNSVMIVLTSFKVEDAKCGQSNRSWALLGGADLTGNCFGECHGTREVL